MSENEDLAATEAATEVTDELGFGQALSVEMPDTSDVEIVVVDDDPIVADSLADFLTGEGYAATTAGNGREALSLLEMADTTHNGDHFAIVITDINMPRCNGMELLKRIQKSHPSVVPIVITGFGKIESAVETIKQGAVDYLTKPVIDDELRLAVSKAVKQHALVAENQTLRSQLSQRYGMGNLVGADYRMQKVYDLITAVENLMTPKLRAKAKQRIEQTRAFGEKARELSALVTKNPYWDQSPMLAGRVTYELTQFADEDAIIVDETESAGPKHMFEFNPLGGREYIRSHYGHLGSGVGTAAGGKLARPDQQVICMTGDGGFIFGPTALWNMARLELPVIVVVYNNHAYSGPHNRAFSNLPEGRMVETGHFVHDYLGNPDIDMAYIAKGFGVDGEVVESPDQLKAALARARKSTRDGKPYLIDAQVARASTLWADKPWIPPISGAKMRTRKV